MTEQVLVFPASVLEEQLPSWGGGIICAENPGSNDDALATIVGEILSQDNLKYVDRASAETDPSLKQVIPYIVVRKGNLILTYQRTKKSGESRLAGKHSLGFGGHINPHDGDNGLAYEKCFWRELAEELGVVRQRGEEMPAPVAVLYEPWTPVGSVHFGVVHILDVSDSFVFEPDVDASIADVGWMDKQSLYATRDEFENWSAMVIDNVL